MVMKEQKSNKKPQTINKITNSLTHKEVVVIIPLTFKTIYKNKANINNFEMVLRWKQLLNLM